MIFSRSLHTADIFISFEWQKGLFGDLDTWVVLNPHVVCDPLLVILPRENGHPGCCSSQAAQPWAHPPRFVGFGCACFRCMDSKNLTIKKRPSHPQWFHYTKPLKMSKSSGFKAKFQAVHQCQRKSHQQNLLSPAPPPPPPPSWPPPLTTITFIEVKELFHLCHLVWHLLC